MTGLLVALALQVAAPPPRIPMPPPPAMALQATSVVPLPFEPGHVIDAAFIVVGERGYLRFTRDDAVIQVVEIASPETAMSILVERRLAALHAPLLAWAGADLVRLRDTSLRRAADAYNAGFPGEEPHAIVESMVRPAMRRVLQYAVALAASGERSAAEALLERERAKIDRTQDWGRAEWAMLTIRLGGMATSIGDIDKAAVILRDARAQAAPGDSYAINFDVNRAAVLAEAGRYREALTLIDAAQAEFAGKLGGRHGVRVKGSDRQFGWIRACALHGLGREAEARRALAPTLTEREPRQDAFVLTPNASLRFRAAACMHDAAAAGRALIEDAADPRLSPSALRLLQPAFRDTFILLDFRRSVAAQPAVAALLTQRMVVLPAALGPALNRWSTP